MECSHLVRVGAMGQIGRFVAAGGLRYPRRERVVVRTRRGLELGEVLAPPNSVEWAPEADGKILRAMTPEDRLLGLRLEKDRHEAYKACVELISRKGPSATLIDVEHLFDGQGLVFYFLGDVTPELEACTEELAEAYETKVKFRAFTETLIAGCGSDCGTDKAEGGCTDCVSCSVSQACGPGRK